MATSQASVRFVLPQTHVVCIWPNTLRKNVFRFGLLLFLCVFICGLICIFVNCLYFDYKFVLFVRLYSLQVSQLRLQKKEIAVKMASLQKSNTALVDRVVTLSRANRDGHQRLKRTSKHKQVQDLETPADRDNNLATRRRERYRTKKIVALDLELEIKRKARSNLRYILNICPLYMSGHTHKLLHLHQEKYH